MMLNRHFSRLLLPTDCRLLGGLHKIILLLTHTESIRELEFFSVSRQEKKMRTGNFLIDQQICTTVLKFLFVLQDNYNTDGVAERAKNCKFYLFKRKHFNSYIAAHHTNVFLPFSASYQLSAAYSICT